jgi:cyclopropane fatty-acyl-phospholipid synthase-like methyltransferase
MSMMNGPGNLSLPSSEACKRNQQPILKVLQQYLPDNSRVIEVGSGTGQHAVFFASRFPSVRWQPTDTGDFLPGLRARVQAEAPPNLAAVLELDVRKPQWPSQPYDVLFSANTLHYMSASSVEKLFTGLQKVLKEQAVVIVYGPFKYDGKFTAPSNERFDGWLKLTDPSFGIRDFEWVDKLASSVGLSLAADVAMPANNKCLVWHKSTA